MNFQTSVKTCFKKYTWLVEEHQDQNFGIFTYSNGLYVILIISAINISYIFGWLFIGFF